jgi:DNA-binding NtrC family response regulator
MAFLMLVDDDPFVLCALQRVLRPLTREGLRIESHVQPQKALSRLGEVRVDVLVSDYRMPGMDGLSLLTEAVRLQPHIVPMVLSASSDFEVVRQAMNHIGLYRYLSKPWDDEQWRSEISKAVEHALTRQEERDLLAAARHQRGQISAADLEILRLEADEPGITQVEWGPLGEVVIPEVLPTQM